MRNTINVVSVLEKLLDQLVNQLLENIAHPTSINQKIHQIQLVKSQKSWNKRRLCSTKVKTNKNLPILSGHLDNLTAIKSVRSPPFSSFQ